MTDQPVPIDRPLTDAERTLMAHLASAVLAQQIGITVNEAADQLKNYPGEIHLTGDAIDCYLTLDGQTIVHVTREWLAFFASHPDEVIDLDKYAQPIDEAGEKLAMPWPWRCVRCHRGSDTLDNDNVCAQCAAEEKP